MGYSSVSHGMFERGAVDLVYHAMARATAHMTSRLREMDLASMSVNQRVKAGVKARLEAIAPFARTWPQAMALGALPQNLPRTLELLGQAVDEIWWQAGDRSTDMNWYSRRALLLGVYTAAETFMLTDSSPDLADTDAFIDRALRDVSQLGRTAGESLAMAQAIVGGVGSILTAAMDAFRPAILAPGQALTAAAAAMPQIPLPGSKSAGGQSTGPSMPPMMETATSVLAPALSIFASAANAVNAAAQSAGVRLPEPPPLLSAMLAVANPATPGVGASQPMSARDPSMYGRDAGASWQPASSTSESVDVYVAAQASTTAVSAADIPIDSVSDVARAAGLLTDPAPSQPLSDGGAGTIVIPPTSDKPTPKP